MKAKKYNFSANIKIIGINPYVSIPRFVLKSIFIDAKKDKGPIPVMGTVNEKLFMQTLVKYAGEWRLYINTRMLKNSPDRIGEKIEIAISFDPRERKIGMHPLLKAALEKNLTAKSVFQQLTPSKQKEIVRYISHLKTEKTIISNVSKAINFLIGKDSFAGRDKP